MKDNGVVPYILSKHRKLHLKIQDETLTSDEEDQAESDGSFHRGPQISPEQRK